jgi:GrpB-like predicted nucleotidyltransferase (UPF0157 family)
MPQYEGEERRINHWHLDKRLNIGHIISTAILAIAAFSYASKIDNRITSLEVAMNYQRDTNTQVTEQLVSINNKLDRLIERLSVR